MQCAALIARVIISEDGKFTKGAIELADELLKCSWNNNVTDFLHVIAGTAHAAPLALMSTGKAVVLLPSSTKNLIDPAMIEEFGDNIVTAFVRKSAKSVEDVIRYLQSAGYSL